MRRTIFILAGLSVVTLLGCSSGSSDESTTTSASESTTTESTTTTASEDGPVVSEPGPVALEVGGRATLELSANQTTGYQWELAAEPDAAIVSVVSDTYVAAESDAMGAGGTQRVVVEGVAAGTTTLELRYVRPWEADAEPAETATYELTVT